MVTSEIWGHRREGESRKAGREREGERGREREREREKNNKERKSEILRERGRERASKRERERERERDKERDRETGRGTEAGSGGRRKGASQQSEWDRGRGKDRDRGRDRGRGRGREREREEESEINKGKKERPKERQNELERDCVSPFAGLDPTAAACHKRMHKLLVPFIPSPGPFVEAPHPKKRTNTSSARNLPKNERQALPIDCETVSLLIKAHTLDHCQNPCLP